MSWCAAAEVPFAPGRRVGYAVNKTTGCWEWSGYRDRQGYGRVTHDGKAQFAHRVYYIRSGREIPDGAQIDHLCRNPSCCNPAHLEAVSSAENLRRGDRAKISVRDVRSIRAAFAAGGVSHQELAERYGITRGHVSDIIGRQCWKDVWSPSVPGAPSTGRTEA